MNWILGINLGLLLLIGVLYWQGRKHDSDAFDLNTVAVLALVVLVSLGFGIWGTGETARREWKEVGYTYARGKSVVVIEADGLTKEFFDAKTYNSIGTTPTVFVKTDYNSYGFIISREILTEKGQ